MSNILERLKHERLYFDGGTGTVLQKMGLISGESPEIMNLEKREAVLNLHLDYLNAGADIIKTNTFGINSLKYDDVEKQLKAAVDIAKEAVSLSGRDAYVAFDVGPTGRMLVPFGDLSFEDAVEIFAQNMSLAEKLGADLILIETMSDMYETKAAVLAAKENSTLPIFVTCAFGSDGKLLTGADPSSLVAMFEGIGVSAIGINCSGGPHELLGVLEEFIKYSSVPIVVNPNAGLPTVVSGEAVYNMGADEFAECVAKMCYMGASIVGGCCGTTPEHIRALVEKTSGIEYKVPERKDITLISSYTHSVEIGTAPKIVGERINPTGKPKLKAALRNRDVSYILSLAVSQEERGADILDVNVGLADIDEKEMMCRVISELRGVTDLPLQIDTGNPKVMEAAMRVYCGKPLVNSVTGADDIMDAVFPLIKKYGGTVIALTMDEDGIPQTAEGRVKIAEKIVKKAKEYGIDKKELIFDPLVLTVASAPDNARITLDALKKLKARGYKCSLGISNVSFGLPERDVINSTFYTAALFEGLDLAIINPESTKMMDAHRSYALLSGEDKGAQKYITYMSNTLDELGKKPISTDEISLSYAIEHGLKDMSESITRSLLTEKEGLAIIDGYIIPALNKVGADYEAGRTYLPALLMSAEAANASFSIIRSNTETVDKDPSKKLVLATVKGDIHDIGKNIVKLMFESYGYTVIDLGHDVDKSTILQTLQDCGAELLGLSALMTTTLGAMEDTVRLVKECLPRVKIMVGGAVLTNTYAKKIGADFFAKDALSAIRYCSEVF